MTRHRFDPLSFIFGALFVVVAAVGLIDRELLTVGDLRWIAPGLLVATGALLLVLSGRRTGGSPEPVGTTSDQVEPDRDAVAVEGDDPER